MLRVLCFLIVIVLPRFVWGDEPDFARDVRPILSSHCFKCHGPDESKRHGGLRLDTRETALKPADSGAIAIVPGNVAASELVKRILSSDENSVMPPPDAKIPLTAEKKEVLRKWIAAGAIYKPHWAFQVPQRPALPIVKHEAWPKNAIDRFVLAKIEAAGLSPAPAADSRTLVRRLYLDLIGLPPSPEEAAEFLNDHSPQAYEKLVDRLLQSPHYGERWARRWLDLARYADTNGYEKDRPRTMWPYRDWVINALNQDMPFDQFTVEQIAGDLLPNATTEQKIATGFHRNTMINEEGGIDPQEFRFYSLVDRVNTTGTIWLGLTLGCVQCHTHKYDPISHTDYYRLMAFLNNADEPEFEIPDAKIAGRRKDLEQQIAKQENLLIEKGRAQEEPFLAWLRKERERAVTWTQLIPAEADANLPILTIQSDGSIFASSDQSKSDLYTLKFRSTLKDITAIRIEAMPDDRLPRRGPGRVYYEGPIGDFTLTDFKAFAAGETVKFASASHSFASGKFTADAAIDDNKQTGWSINGGQGKTHFAVFKLAQTLADASELRLEMAFERHYAAGLGRFRVWVTTASEGVEARDVPVSIEPLFIKAPEQLTDKEREQLLLQFALSSHENAKEREAITKLRQQKPEYLRTLVMSERPANEPRTTFVHKRGEFLQPTEKVSAGLLSLLPSAKENAPVDRLGFARWLVSDQNPLVGRVTMNRQWQAFFGRGLVKTTEDFGYQGELPTHPELLDWLALEFASQKWSFKRMHKLIVMSATYQQSADVQPTTLAKDPENRLLARFPRQRLEAELVRDNFLKISGLLSHKIGGPSVFPPQLASVTTEGAYGKLDWKVSQGEDRYRRGLYTFLKRTAPYAMFQTFDAPSGEACVARREVSTTPLQALMLLNDEVFVETARAFGNRVARRDGTNDEKLKYLFEACLTRQPMADELQLLTRFFVEQQRRLESKELDAPAIAGAGPEEVQRAAWVLTARIVMNLDEAIVRP